MNISRIILCLFVVSFILFSGNVFAESDQYISNKQIADLEAQKDRLSKARTSACSIMGTIAADYGDSIIVYGRYFRADGGSSPETVYIKILNPDRSFISNLGGTSAIITAWYIYNYVDTVQIQNDYGIWVPLYIYRVDQNLVKNEDRIAEINSQIDSIRQSISNAVGFNDRGVFSYDKGQLDQAIANFNQALALYPQYAVAYNNRGSAYSQKGQLDQAIADYNQALSIDPQYAQAYSNRGCAYADKGQLDQALADQNQALSIDPQNYDAYYNRGDVYKAKGLIDQAITDYTEAIKIKPKRADTYNSRGLAYSAKGQIIQAVDDYTQAIKIDPKYAAAYYNKARAYEKAGLKREAIEAYRQCLVYLANNPQRVNLIKQYIAALGG